MKKNYLKTLVKEIYENLQNNIETSENITKEQVINYLKDTIDAVSNINDTDIDSIEQAKATFNNTYKELMDESLNSYEYTNEKFGELTQLHEKALNECVNDKIDFSTLTDKFGEIQSHMTKEVKKANKMISELSDKVKTLEETSNLDALTKIFNRRALDSYLKNICCEIMTSCDLHLIMLDLDDFKNINDTYGHVAGDKILIFISNILRKTLRDGDKIFRYGGEEFVIMLNRNSTKECELIANRILKLISSNKLIYKGEQIFVTASIGYTKFNKYDDPDTLLSRADEALYISKNNGKNQASKVII
jgi:diguanylate cyclase (GGDEF)-like protein